MTSPPATHPGWLDQLVVALPTVLFAESVRWPRPPEGAAVRRSAVLVLFGEGEHGPDLLLIERASTLRSHAGQPAFPGGVIDPGDSGAVAAALREAHEEVGLDPTGVEVLGTLPDLYLPPSRFLVTPVLAWWRKPHPVRVVDTAEVAAVVRVPLSVLTDPARRVTVTHPSGFEGPGFETDQLFVWGFTAGVVDRLLAHGGWEQPWDRGRRRALAAEVVALARRTGAPERDRSEGNRP